MAHTALYIDTYAEVFVNGPTNNGLFILPPFKQNDTKSFRIYLLERTTSYPLNPYTVMSLSGLSLAFALGDKAGNGDGDHVVEQFTWNINTSDPARPYFYADVAFNTAELATALGSSAQITKWFEIEYRQNSVPTTVYQRQHDIHADVIKQATQTLGPGETAISAQTADATYLKKDGTNDTGDIKIWRNAATGKRVMQYVDDDGNMKFDPLT